ncbi:MAG: hypothetical protein WAW88_12285 [Nocardioides sp.]
MISASELGAAKLVVWDLDGTLWTGTLDDGDELQPTGLHRWIEPLARAGVMSSVCSNNDSATAEVALRGLGVWDYLVFPKVSWAPKGELLSELITDRGVRAADVLFVDDMGRHRTLATEELGCRSASPTEVDPYIGQLAGQQSSDRLDQYRTLERRVESRRDLKLTDEDFLRRSGITVTITSASLHLSRLASLSQRSNQLNFTASRLDESALAKLVSEPGVQAGAVWVHDNYGDYGLAGFFACRGSRLEHYYFSCRVLNMGVESFVHMLLGRPELRAEGANVRAEQWLRLRADAPWIQLADGRMDAKETRPAALWVGGCDLQILSGYLGSDADADSWLLPTERGGAQVYARSSLLALLAGQRQREDILSTIPWLTADAADVRSGHWRSLVLSPWVDCASWTYRHRGTGFRIPSFVELDADSTEWEWGHWWGDNPDRGRFIDEFQLDAPLSPEEVAGLLARLAGVIEGRRLLVLTVPEIESDRTYAWGELQRDRHVAFNRALESVARDIETVELLDVRRVVTTSRDLHDQDDPLLFHYRRECYLDLARQAQTHLVVPGAEVSN